MSTAEIITNYVAAIAARYPEKAEAARALCEKYSAEIGAIRMDSTGCKPDTFAMSVMRQALLKTPAFAAEYRTVLGGK